MEFEIVKAQQQYLYEVSGIEFIDCTSNEAHVGHCHPQMVSRGKRQMDILMAGQGFFVEQLDSYGKELISTLPEKLNICYLVNSRSEANDLAIRLARNYTKNSTFVVHENSDHGHFRELRKISPKAYHDLPPQEQEGFIIPVPYVKGKVNHETIVPNEHDITESTLRILDSLAMDGQRVAGFISESVLVSHGVIIPPRDYYKKVYTKIKSLGGINIGEETNSGLGRLGECFWGFKLFDVVPDIVTIGPSIGNGYPMSAVVTSREISNTLDEYNSTFGGNPVSCVMGSTLLNIINKEKLVTSGTAVGRTLMHGLDALREDCHVIHEIRGMGLCIGVHIRSNEVNSEQFVKQLIHRMKMRHHFVLGTAPSNATVIVIKPPMCFNQQNARSLLVALRESFIHLQNESSTTSDSESAGASKRIKFAYNDVD